MAADDDAEVFEITDFTTASDWERFISRVEEILHEWKLVSCNPKPPANKNAYADGTWEEKTEELCFADFKFMLTHIWLKSSDENLEKSAEKEGAEDEGDDDSDEEKSAEKEGAEDEGDDNSDEEVVPTVYMDLMSAENDFPSRAHCICRWYGLQDFVILCPANNLDAIMSETKAKLLLSSVHIALSDAGCTVPLFVQVQQKWRRMYVGTSVLPGSAVEMGMVHLKRAPPQYNHLAGLLDVFKAKMGCMSDPRPPVSVAVRFLYVLYDWVNSPWSQPLPDFDSEVGCKGFDELPFGACEDPVSALNLYCTWPCLSEDMIVENQVYSDLDPLQAPQWSVRIQMTEDPQCLLGEYLISFLALCHRKETLEQLVGSLGAETTEHDGSSDISTALQRLTEPSVSYTIPSLSSYVPHPHKHKPKTKDAAIQGPLLDQIIQFLFPDAAKPMTKDDDELVPSTSAESSAADGQPDNPLAKDLCKQLKSAPVGGLIHRLAVCLCVLNKNHGGLFAVAQMWQEFILEMRYRWDYNYLIDGVDPGPPNLGSCILQQKLQMLNCCIEHKKKREQLHKGYSGEPDSAPASPSRGPSTSSVARSMSLEGVPLEDQSEVESAGNSQSAVTAKNRDQSDADNSNMDQTDAKTNLLGAQKLSSDVSSDDDEEFFECDETDNHSDEKDVDTIEDQSSSSQENQTEITNENTAENQSSENITEDQSLADITDGQSTENAAEGENQTVAANEIAAAGENQTVAANENAVAGENHTVAANENAAAGENHTVAANENAAAGENQNAAANENVTLGDESDSAMECDDTNNSTTGVSSTPRVSNVSDSSMSVGNMSTSCDSAFKESFSHKPEGRLAPYQDLRLINCDERMFIPITQEPAPMTEDMLEEHAEVLAKLGSSAEGAELRARMQSACLLSDMESFKSANPGCVLEDFVRWYSPRDWVEETVTDENGEVASQGHLSLRMQIPGNMWVEVWQTARPVPARRQKRLFDDTREAEKVLHFFSSLKPADVVVHLLPMLIHAALLKAMDNDDPKIPVLKQVLEQASTKASHVTRAPRQDAKRYEELIRMILQAEIIIARNISLKSKFTEELLERPDAREELDVFVTSILQNSEVSVRGGPLGPAGTVINKLFHAAQRASYMLLDEEDQDDRVEEERQQSTSVPNFPRPSAREYILRTIVPRPAPYSKQLPQRMFCSIEEEEIRLAGAFASDTVFQ